MARIPRLWIYWGAGFILMGLTLFYQHLTGPTYEKRISFSLSDRDYKFELPRSHGGDSDCSIDLEIPDTEVTGAVYFRKYKSDESFKEVILTRKDAKLSAMLPHQPPAGKLEYFVLLKKGNGEAKQITGKETVVIRFKGDVPLWILRVHIFFMFLSMLLSNVAGLTALAKHASYKKLAGATALSLLIGGFILGPIVQKYAFGVWWSGIPFGWDLTDNKLLFALLAWLVALIFSLKQNRFLPGVIAATLLILMYAIPHSTLGSELDYKSGKVQTSKEFKL